MIVTHKVRALAGVAIMLPILAACGGSSGGTLPQTVGGGGGSTQTLPSGSPSPMPSAAATATATFNIVVPNVITTSARDVRHPLFVSPNTHSLSIALVAINGKTSTASPLVMPVGSGVTGCVTQAGSTLSCTASMTVPAKSYDTFTVSTYSSQNGTGSVLSSTTVTQTFAANQATSVPFTLGGVVASISMSPSAIHTVQGSGTASYLVSLTAKDSSGAVILGNSTLQSPISIQIENDPNHSLLVNESTLTSPGTPLQVRYDGSKTLADGQIVASYGAVGSAKTDVIPLSFTPATISGQMGTAAQNVALSEVGFSGQFTATVDDPAVASATVTSTGSGTANVAVQPAALGGSSGPATITVNDGSLSATIPVTVTAPRLPGITYYQEPPTQFSPFEMVLNPSNGNIYLTSIQGLIDEFNPATQAFHSYSLQSFGFGTPRGIAVDNNGNVWVTYNSYISPQICEMTLPAHTLACYNTGLQSGASPYDIAYGSDGGMWFTDGDYNSPAIGRIDPALHTIVEYTMGLNSGANPSGIVAGTDGNMYFSDVGSTPAFGSISTSSDVINEYSTGLAPYNPQTQQVSTPYYVTLGSDGNVWSSDAGEPSIDQFVISTHQTTQHFNGIQRYGNPWAIRNTPSGDIWFTDAGLFSPPLLGDVKVSSGFVQEYGGFPANATGSINGVVATSPTDLWFFDQQAHAMGHVTIP